jgi:hypothetical protein
MYEIQFAQLTGKTEHEDYVKKIARCMGYLVQNGRVTVSSELERAWTRLTCSKILLQHLPEVQKRNEICSHTDEGSAEIRKRGFSNTNSGRQSSRFVAS